MLGKLGEVTSTAASRGAIVAYPNAKTTMNAGKYSATTWYAIKNMGDMTINGGTITNGTDTASVVDNGWYGSTATDRGQGYPANGKNAKLTITGGTFEGTGRTISVIKNDDYGTLDIRGGNFDNRNTSGETVLNWNKASISGGNFKSANYTIMNCSAEAGKTAGELTINGGTFESGTGKNIIYADNNASIPCTITINGGTFKNNISGVVASGNKCAIKVLGGNLTAGDSTVTLEEGLKLNDKNIVCVDTTELEELVKAEKAKLSINTYTEETRNNLVKAIEEAEKAITEGIPSTQKSELTKLTQNIQSADTSLKLKSVADLEEKLAELEKKLTDVKTERDDLKKETDTLKGEVTKLQEQAKKDEADKAKLEEEAKELQSKIEKLEKEVEESKNNTQNKEEEKDPEETDKKDSEENGDKTPSEEKTPSTDKKEDNSINPKTGDSIMLFAILFVVATLGAIITTKKAIKNLKTNH